MLTVITKFLAPTNNRGARIKVISARGNKVYPYDHSAECAHKAAFDTWLEDENAEMRRIYEKEAADILRAMGRDCPPAKEVVGNWFKLVAYASTPDNTGFAFIIK